jgi:amino acid permease
MGTKSKKDLKSHGSEEAHHEESMSYLGGVATTVNYIVGAGLLGIPGVVAKAGLVLSPLIIVAMGW